MQYTGIGWHYDDGRSIVIHIEAKDEKEAKAKASIAMGRAYVIFRNYGTWLSLENVKYTTETSVGSCEHNWVVGVMEGKHSLKVDGGIYQELPDPDNLDAWGELATTAIREYFPNSPPIIIDESETIVERCGRKVRVHHDLFRVSGSGLLAYEHSVNTDMEAEELHRLYAIHPMEDVVCLGDFAQSDCGIDGKVDKLKNELGIEEYYVFTADHLRQYAKDITESVEKFEKMTLDQIKATHNI